MFMLKLSLFIPCRYRGRFNNARVRLQNQLNCENFSLRWGELGRAAGKNRNIFLVLIN